MEVHLTICVVVLFANDAWWELLNSVKVGRAVAGVAIARILIVGPLFSV